ncbi:hypothetical protein MRX96_005831 [Rhipicephalus microplus]
MELYSSRRLGALDLKTADCFDCQDVFGNGSFQRRLLLVASLCAFVVHCHTVAFTLISPDVDHWCRKPPGLNISAAEWKREVIPPRSRRPESPRWLIASRELEEAGAVILSVAEINNFEPLSTNFLMNMVRAEAARNEALRYTASDTSEGPEGPGSDIRRRAFFVLATHAVITFAAQVLILSSAVVSVRHLWWLSSGTTMLSYVLLYTFPARAVSMKQLLSVSLVTLIVLACASAILAAVGLAPLLSAILAAAKAVAFFAIVVHAVYVVEVFPTSVRVTALSWVSVAWAPLSRTRRPCLETWAAKT